MTPLDPAHRQSLEHPLLTGALFYPQRLTPAEVPEMTEGRVLAIPVGADSLGAYHYCPHPAGPTVLFFHGNGEVMTDYLDGFHLELARLGLNFLVVDYRGYGLSTGAPSLPKLLEDANAAWDFAAGAMGLAPGDIIVMGRSLGSLAAMEIAAHHGSEFRALVIESGIGGFERWIDRMLPLLSPHGLDAGRLKDALHAAFDHQAKMKAVTRPVLIMHTHHDEIVPVEQARILASFSDPARTTVNIFPHGGHNDIHYLNRDQYFHVLGDFLGRTD
jgi:pimeloyl-ACP methyl ester carboxylesterase